MKNSLVQNQLKLYQKLYSALPKIRTLNKQSDRFDFDKNVDVVYYHKKRVFWFTKAEDKNTYYFLFGLKKSNKLSLDDAVLVIDFNDINLSLGTLINESGDVRLLLNYDIFNKRYPAVNINDFKCCMYEKSPYIDLGFINKDLIDNLEKLVKRLDQIPLKKEVETIHEDKCECCGDDIVQFSKKYQNIKKIKPNLCEKCIEKIIVCEFYNKIEPLLPDNESKSLNLVKEDFGNDALFNYCLQLLEKYKIFRFIGVKKLFFSLSDNNEILKTHMSYINEDKYLMDLIDISGVLLEKTKKEMNLFINSLEADKSHADAYKLAKINEKVVQQWFKLGSEGNHYFVDFYKRYDKYNRRFVLMNKFLKFLRIDNDLNKALKHSNLNLKTVKKWYESGKSDKSDCNYFYNECEKISPNLFDSDDELITKFIDLRRKGKSNSQAINELRIPKNKIDQWIKQANSNNPHYSAFNKLYNHQYNVTNRNKKSKKSKKIKCRICGRKITDKNIKGICKRCEKKQFACKIIVKLLKFIEPEKEFNRDDLNVLNLSLVQTKEYIWTLREFNLLIEKNNKFKIVNREELVEFFTSCDMNIDEIPQNAEKSIYKTCVKCQKSLKKSNFHKGDDVCKECKEHDLSIKYLNEILEYVDYDNEFTQDDLLKYFDDPFKLQAKLWLLADKDLIIKNFNNDSYKLANKDVIADFLGKDIEDTNSSMQKVLDEIAKGNSRFNASKNTGIALSLITSWYNDGKSEKNKETVDFYNEVNRLEEINNINSVIDDIKKGNAISIDNKTLEDWKTKGISGIKPYDKFYREYQLIVGDDYSKIQLFKYPGYKTTVNQMNNVIDNLSVGLNEKQAVKKANVEFDTYNYWLNRGKKEFGDLYVDFYNIVDKLLSNGFEKQDDGILTLIPDDIEKKLQKYSRGNKTGFAWVNKIGNKYKYSRTINKKLILIEDEDIHGLYNKVKNENLLWGVRDLQKAKKIVKKIDGDSDIYKPLDEEYLKTFKNNSTSTGIAWVKKLNNKYVYSRKVGKNLISFSDDDIVELFSKVSSQNQIWGILDYEKASKIMDIPPEVMLKYGGKKVNDVNIYKPIDDKYLKLLSRHPTSTGIAWVNKNGNYYTYLRSVNKKIVSFKDEDIVELFKKVNSHNQVWGIRDYKKASKIIDIPKYILDAYGAGKKVESKKIDLDSIDDDSISQTDEVNKLPDIYDELLEEYKDLAKPTNTGIAWVNRVGDKWVYNLKIDDKIMRLRNSDINVLFEKVIENNGIWGIIDLDKAKNSINPEIYSTEKIGSVSVNYIDKSKTQIKVIISGDIKNNQFYHVLKKLEIFELSFKRMMTTNVKDRLELFIELEISRNTKNFLEDKLKDLGWEINR